MADSLDITALLDEWRQGADGAFDQLALGVYSHLHDVAAVFLRGERSADTLQATAIVNELFLRLMRNRQVQYSSREHFFTFSAKLMRRVLVDHARQKQSEKRGAGAFRVALVPELAWINAASAEVLDLDNALSEFSQEFPDKLRLLELRFFLGATAQEVADLSECSRSQVNRDIDFSVSWLHRRLKASRVQNPGQIDDGLRQPE